MKTAVFGLLIITLTAWANPDLMDFSPGYDCSIWDARYPDSHFVPVFVGDEIRFCTDVNEHLEKSTFIPRFTAQFFRYPTYAVVTQISASVPPLCKILTNEVATNTAKHISGVYGAGLMALCWGSPPKKQLTEY
jgi:hypothetical protein